MPQRAAREPLRSPDLVQSTLAEGDGRLLRLARRYSLCADDAQDAYQRAVEIFLRRQDTIEPETALSWLHSVVRNEAIAVRESRLRLVGREEVDLDRREATTLPSPDERVITADVTARSNEALGRLKPHEVRALWLKAQGHSYAEIGELTGWTYTKVNRCLTEGRRAFLERYAGIEAGTECLRWARVLSAMADGEATPEQLADARPHLRNCPACRATLREFHEVPREVGALVPAVVGGGLLGSLRTGWSSMRGALGGLVVRSSDGGGSAGAAVLGGGGGSLAAGGAKVAALCASVSIAAGGAYCLDQTGALHAEPGAGPKLAEPSKRERALAAAADRDRATDREVRRAAANARVKQVASVERTTKRRRRAGESPRRPTPIPPQPPTDGFDFESGRPAMPSASPQTPARPALNVRQPTGDFDGGAFEVQP